MPVPFPKVKPLIFMVFPLPTPSDSRNVPLPDSVSVSPPDVLLKVVISVAFTALEPSYTLVPEIVPALCVVVIVQSFIE